MLRNFRCYQLAKDLYGQAKQVSFKGELRDQLSRAALSICLNLAEGTDRTASKERTRFFTIALTSLREVQAIIDLENLTMLQDKADALGAHIYKLCKAQRIT